MQADQKKPLVGKGAVEDATSPSQKLPGPSARIISSRTIWHPVGIPLSGITKPDSRTRDITRAYEAVEQRFRAAKERLSGPDAGGMPKDEQVQCARLMHGDDARDILVGNDAHKLHAAALETLVFNLRGSYLAGNVLENLGGRKGLFPISIIKELERQDSNQRAETYMQTSR